jgi:hypothetical protein
MLTWLSNLFSTNQYVLPDPPKSQYKFEPLLGDYHIPQQAWSYTTTTTCRKKPFYHAACSGKKWK